MFEHLQVEHLAGVLTGRVAGNHEVLSLRCGILDPAGHLREEGVPAIDDNQPEDSGTAAPQLAGGTVGDKAAFRDRREDSVACRFADDVRGVEHVGDGSNGYSGRLRHVEHRHALHAPSVVNAA